MVREHRAGINQPSIERNASIVPWAVATSHRYVRGVARPYGKTTILVTVSPIRIAEQLVGLSQIVLLKDGVQDIRTPSNISGRESFEREMLPNATAPSRRLYGGLGP